MAGHEHVDCIIKKETNSSIMSKHKHVQTTENRVLWLTCVKHAQNNTKEQKMRSTGLSSCSLEGLLTNELRLISEAWLQQPAAGV